MKKSSILKILFILLTLFGAYFIWNKFGFGITVIYMIAISFIFAFISLQKQIAILKYGKWENAVIEEKELISRISELSGELSRREHYEFKIKLIDINDLILKRVAFKNSYTDRLSKGQKIRILFFKDDFLFDDEVKDHLKNRFMKKYTKRFKNDF